MTLLVNGLLNLRFHFCFLSPRREKKAAKTNDQQKRLVPHSLRD